jgi:hypothetical protein
VEGRGGRCEKRGCRDTGESEWRKGRLGEEVPVSVCDDGGEGAISREKRLAEEGDEADKERRIRRRRKKRTLAPTTSQPLPPAEAASVDASLPLLPLPLAVPGPEDSGTTEPGPETVLSLPPFLAISSLFDRLARLSFGLKVCSAGQLSRRKVLCVQPE